MASSGTVATDTQEYRDLCAKLKFVAGTPGDVAARIETWHADLGCDEVLCQTYAAGTNVEDALRSMELFSEEVAPHFLHEPVTA